MTRKQIEQKAKEEFPDEPLSSDEYTRKMRQSFLELFRKCFIQGAEFALSHQWVSVEDELPPAKGRGDAISNRVIVRTIDNSYYMDHYDHTYKCWGTELIVKTKVTHWMPIPPIAEEGGEK